MIIIRQVACGYPSGRTFAKLTRMATELKQRREEIRQPQVIPRDERSMAMRDETDTHAQCGDVLAEFVE